MDMFSGLTQEQEINRLLANIALRIRQSLNLEEILNKTVDEVRQLLKTDRVIVYRFNPDWSGIAAVESVNQAQWSIVGDIITDPCFEQSWLQIYREGKVKAIENIYKVKVINNIHTDEIHQCYIEFLEQFQIKASLVAPILQDLRSQKTDEPIPHLWGLLIAHECLKPRKWKVTEIDFLQQLGTQVAIAIQQAELLEQTKTELRERQKAEALLKESEERFRRLTENAQDVIYRYCLLPKPNIKYINPAIADITGYSPGEFYADSDLIFHIIHPEDREQFRQQIYQPQKQRALMILRWLSKEGEVIWIEQHYTLIQDENEQLIAVEGIARNVSQQILSRQHNQQTQDINFSFDRVSSSLAQVIQQQQRDQLTQALKLSNENLEKQVGKRTKALSTVNKMLRQEISDRQQAEKELQELNQELEIRVQQRTSDLQESEQRFRSLFESAPDFIHVLDIQGIIQQVNPAVIGQSGYSESELIGHNLEEFFTPKSQEICQREYPLLLEQGNARQEMEFVCKDGTILTMDSACSVVCDALGKKSYIMVLQRNISDRQQIEEERAKLIAILEATSDFVALASVDEQIHYLNDAARQLLGFAKNEDLENFTIRNAHSNWAYEIVQNEGIPSAISNDIWLGETAFLSHDKDEIPVSELIIAHKSPDGEVKQYSTVARDISQQKKVEGTLRETERRWRTLLENVRLVVVGLDQDGKVDYVNPFFLELTGYTKTEAIGKNWFETFLPQSQQQQAQNNFLEVLEQLFHPHNKNSIITKSGEEKIIAWNNTRLQNFQGEGIGTLSIGEDITERFALERMKDEFISVVSHEIRTPLTSIHGALNLLSTGLVISQSQQGKRVLQIAAESAERLVRLVNDILELERLESGKINLNIQQVNATELMLQAVEQMQVMANRAGIILSVSEKNIEFNADGDRIIQVLTNLLSNAIKFSPRNSTVWLSVVKNSTILFKVQDQGRGIPADKINSIFERFHQVDATDSRNKGGTGLGLAICRSIVEQHNGQIWAESTLGEGSIFYFALPL